MLLQASEEHIVDLNKSFMVGDKLADIEAGQRAGCQPVLVMTGYGAKVAEELKLAGVEKCRDLGAVAEFIVEQVSKNKAKL